MMGEYDAGYENCINGMVKQMEDMQFRIDNLHRENAKLRELVADIYASAEFWLDHFGQGHEFRKRIKELGVSL